MNNVKYAATIIILLYTGLLHPAEVSISSHLGYSPVVGGSMSSGWQADAANLAVEDGINDINRSGGGLAVSSVENPLGVIAGVDIRLLSDSIYYKAGIEYVYVISGGVGKTINPAGTELVEVTYSQWSFDAPFTIGISHLFWGESWIYLGIGAAFAYGTYSNSFKSVTLNHSGSFNAYAIPLVAELGCEYIINEKFTIGCDIKYLHGKSGIIEDGTDFARVDFTGFHITASASLYFNF